MIKLLGPQHTGKRLSVYHCVIGLLGLLLQRIIKFISFCLPCFKYSIKIIEGNSCILAQPQTKGNTLFSRNLDIIVNSNFSTHFFRIDSSSSMNNIIVYTILIKWIAIVVIVQALGIGFIIAKQQFR